MRITAWLLRFLGNIRYAKERRIEGPLTTGDLEKAEIRLTSKAQQQVDETFTRDQLQLNLQLNEDGVLECRGRVQGFYPVYIPNSSLLARKFVEHAHKSTLHGGVGLTMVNVRERCTLDPSFTTISKAGYSRLPWMQEIPRHCLRNAPSSELTNHQNRRIHCIPSYRN